MDITSIDSNIIVENEEDKSISVQNKDIMVVNSEPEFEVTVQRKEYSIVGDELYIPKRYEDAPQWLRDLISTVTEESYARKITDLNNLSKSLQQLIVELEVAKNTYTQSIISSNDINERINTAVTTLNSSLSSSDATIVDLISTKATPEEASAIALNTISSSINNGEIGALVGSISNTLATETEALANNIDLIHAEMSDGFEGTADSIRITQAYVGIDESGGSTGTGLLADVQILQNQIDGKIESWYTLSTNDPKTAWIDAPTRAKHEGDMWYQTDTKLSYYYSSSTNSWNLIADAKAIQALADAATAQATADGKISSYYMSTLAAANVMSNAWTATEKTNNIGDLVVVWDDSTLNNNGTWRWNGTNWVTTRDKKLIALASDVTNLSTELTNGTNTWASADSTLENSLRTKITDEGARVESKFAYNSIVNINGVYKKSGFGLTSNYTNGNGTISNPYVSEFWIDASKLKFTNSNITGSVAPFTIDASGSIPKVTFNGTLSVLSAVNGVGGVTPTGFSSLGFFDTTRDQNAIGAVNRTMGGYGVSGIGTNTSSSVGVHGRGVYGVLGETINGSGYWGLITQQRCYSGQGFSSPVTTISFTGGHTCFANTPIMLGDILEVVSGYLMTIDQSYTIVTTATTEKSKRVFGVASKVSDDVEANLRDYADIHEAGDDISTLGEYKEEYKPFIDNLINNNYKDVTANSIGEGGINVCSINGDIENGDYITSSSITGKGAKQNDNLLHNYTVAKALESVVWGNEVVGENGCFEFEGIKCKMISCTYHCG